MAVVVDTVRQRIEAGYNSIIVLCWKCRRRRTVDLRTLGRGYLDRSLGSIVFRCRCGRRGEVTVLPPDGVYRRK